MSIKPFRKALAPIAIAALVFIYLQLIFIQITVPVVFMYRYINPPVTSVMIYRTVFYKWSISKVKFLSLTKIPLQIRKMILKVEDGNFYYHNGVILAALKNAWETNKVLGRPVYGGSTITMQTARTLFLVPEKSYVRKYFEIIIALEMEQLLGKDRIFELYLNYAEWGKGVFGIESAARYHFSTGVRNLTVDQSMRLVTLLSSPIKYGPYTIQKNGILRSRYLYLTERFL